LEFHAGRVRHGSGVPLANPPQTLYEQLSRQAILTVKAEHVATFLSHRITAQLAQEIGSQFATRIEGTCVRHRFGKSSIKIYDKFGLVLRIETTTNDVAAFKHYRKVEHRQGPATRALAPVRKTIYSLKDLREILLGCNRRYLEYLSSLDDFSAGIRALDRLTQPRPVNGRNLKGLNFFSRVEQSLLAALQRPGFNIAGLRRADLRPLLTQWTLLHGSVVRRRGLDGVSGTPFLTLGSTVPFKANQDRRHHIPKQRHRVTNWAAYDIALRQRGSLTVWFTEAAIAAWKAEPRCTRGGQPRYSALAITTALTLRAVFRLALRQTEGLIASLLQLLGLDLAAPDHSTISRRGETLPVSRPRAGSEPVHLLVDSTGHWAQALRSR